MLAISIVAPNGAAIAAGAKTIEVRSWHPGTLPLLNLLVVQNERVLRAEEPEDWDGMAVAVVDVLEVHEWRPDEVEAACSKGWQPGYLAWSLSNVRPLSSSQRVPARRKLYEVPNDVNVEASSAA